MFCVVLIGSIWITIIFQDVSLFLVFLFFKETKANTLLRFCEILKERGTTLGLGHFTKIILQIPPTPTSSPARFKGLCHRGVFQRFWGQKSHTLHDGHGASWKVWESCRGKDGPIDLCFGNKKNGRGKLVEQILWFLSKFMIAQDSASFDKIRWWFWYFGRAKLADFGHPWPSLAIDDFILFFYSWTLFLINIFWCLPWKENVGAGRSRGALLHCQVFQFQSLMWRSNVRSYEVWSNSQRSKKELHIQSEDLRFRFMSARLVNEIKDRSDSHWSRP